MNNTKKHALAWTVFLSVAVIVGCGGSGGARNHVSFRDIELDPAVKIIPHDGSVVVTAFGDLGLQFRGVPLNLNSGDLYAVIAPVTDEARAQVNHQGGYLSPAPNLHIVPRTKVPAVYHTPGNMDYSHFIVHYGRVIDREVDSGPLALEGSRAHSQPAADFHTRKFIHHIAHSVSHAVTHGASSATHAVTHSATSAASTVTHASVAAAKAVTSVATSTISGAESAVTHAVSSIGPIDQAITTIHSVGAHFSKLVKAAAMDIEHKAIEIANDIKDFAEFIVTGDMTASVDSSGNLHMSFANYQVQSKDGSATVTLDGDMSFAYSEKGSITIHDYVPQGLSFDYTADFHASLDVTDIKGHKTIPLRKYKLKPVVIDIGIPVVVTREIDVDLVVAGEVSGLAGVDVAGGFDAGMSMHLSSISAHGSPHLSAHLTPPTIEGTNGFIQGILRITPKFNIDDLGGPYLKFDLAELLVTDNGSERTLESKIYNRLSVGADLSPLGYHGWTGETKVYEVKPFDHVDHY